jgi:guanosine-3',5'-bis(diphosphate) 3'-pyrophosphohydrolase
MLHEAKKSLDMEFEKAVRFLTEHLQVSEEGSRKPVLFHDIRVGMHLYEKNYSRDVVLAGLLHDTLEWSSVTQDLLEKEFGENILKLVKANTKDRSIADGDERIEELAKRAAECSKEALIVRSADTLDSFKHYTKTQNKAELDYCHKNAEAILKYKPVDFQDGIFDEVEEWVR